MRVQTSRRTSEELGRRLLRLDGLPLRPTTARTFLQSLPVASVVDDPDETTVADPPPSRALDPGWVVAGAVEGPIALALSTIAGRRWWPSRLWQGPFLSSLDRLWRHSVAVGIASRRLARDGGDTDPDAIGRAGQLCSLGWWAVAAVEPDWLDAWFRQQDPAARARMEQADLGMDLHELGRRLAERWHCDPLVVDAAWLHWDEVSSMAGAASEPGRLAFIQAGYRWAEQTPWSLRAPERPAMPADPRLKVLMAEVQARCGAPFVDPTATVHEERATRESARLRLELARVRSGRDRAERFLELLSDSPAGETADEWADRASRAWCAEPGIAAARISWPRSSPDDPGMVEEASSTSLQGRPPAVVFPLGGCGSQEARVELWCGGSPPDWLRDGSFRRIAAAWGAWAAMLSDRSRGEHRLRAVVAAFRDRVAWDEERLRLAKLDALGEFAAGAGHELNNPLAVVVGRAQLLMARASDPEVARSLRIILNQAQRAHRILRDLMFVARPPAPRPRACKPAEILGTLLADFEGECEARGIRLLSEHDAAPVAWADPEGLRHLAEILMRNALQATTAGGRIHVRSSMRDGTLTWSFRDDGKGIGPEVTEHLFDPFYCGRQAGRGLGLGLPRASRIVEQAGGHLVWSSRPGQETIFQVRLPLATPPEPRVEPRPDEPSPVGCPPIRHSLPG